MIGMKKIHPVSPLLLAFFVLSDPCGTSTGLDHFHLQVGHLKIVTPRFCQSNLHHDLKDVVIAINSDVFDFHVGVFGLDNILNGPLTFFEPEPIGHD